MATPGEYIHKLIESKGAGLTPAERPIFLKMVETDELVTAIEKRIKETHAQLEQLTTDHKIAMGRGQAYAGLLVDVEQGRVFQVELTAKTVEAGPPPALTPAGFEESTPAEKSS